MPFRRKSLSFLLLLKSIYLVTLSEGKFLLVELSVLINKFSLSLESAVVETNFKLGFYVMFKVLS